MQIEIHARGFVLTDGRREAVERRLRFALGRFDERPLRVTVRLSDINGPRGGEDKHCAIRVRVGGLPDIVVEDTEADLYAAVNRATERVARTLRRKLQRARPSFDPRIGESADDEEGWPLFADNEDGRGAAVAY
ncbi:HPF/RaiA family ribosome-associated protein [Aromatoleum sp.]|uniref:HPF/RaiA family ribosome-associated protein n=1 Tax=Aromatoleum sp. TaxID=2307007 RepID=UPI002FC8CC10